MASVVDIRDFSDDYISQSLGKGVTAECFLTKDGTVFKKFDPNWAKLLEEKAMYLQNFESDNFTFPKQLVYLDKKYIGYIRDYAYGKTIDTLSDAINIKRMIEALKKLEESSNILSDKLSLIDLSGENIVYDCSSNKMTIIDTDFFERAENGIYYRGTRQIQTFFDNRTWISQSFYSLTKECEEISKIVSLKIAQALSINMMGFSAASTMLLEIIDELEKLTDREIKTIGDYKNCIKIVKEK